jgi:hypothetical protein
MYFESAKHTEWVFEMGDYLNGLARVEYIMVDENTKYYEMAVGNSNRRFWEAKQVQLMAEFEKYGNKNAVGGVPDDSQGIDGIWEACPNCRIRQGAFSTWDCRGCKLKK